MVQHKNLRIANKTAFLIIGILESAWAPLIPFVKDTFSLDEGEIGFLMLCSGLGALTGLPTAGKLCVRFGAKPIVYLATVVMVICLMLIGLMINVWATAVMLVLFGVCLILIDVSANVNGISIEHKTGKHLMSGFHGGHSLGTLLGSATMSLLLTMGMVPVWAVGVCTTATMVLMLWGCRNLLPKEELLTEKQVDNRSGGFFRIPIMVIVVGLSCFIMYAAQGAVAGWAAIFVSQERGVDIQYAGFFYTAFAVTMTVMRLYGNKIADSLGRHRVVVGGAFFAVAGFLLVILISNVITTALGFSMIGIGAANIVPQLVSFAGSIKGMAIQNIISLINAFGFTGLLMGPVVIGLIAKNYGLHTSFAFIAVSVFVVAIVAYRILKKTNS